MGVKYKGKSFSEEEPTVGEDTHINKLNKLLWALWQKGKQSWKRDKCKKWSMSCILKDSLWLNSSTVKSMPSRVVERWAKPWDLGRKTDCVLWNLERWAISRCRLWEGVWERYVDCQAGALAVALSQTDLPCTEAHSSCVLRVSLLHMHIQTSSSYSSLLPVFSHCFDPYLTVVW